MAVWEGSVLKTIKQSGDGQHMGVPHSLACRQVWAFP